MNNPGKYDDICTMAREAAQADGVILIVINGNKGGGFSVQAPPEVLSLIPAMLMYTAKEIQDDLVKKGLA
jgi:hypothetical protein